MNNKKSQKKDILLQVRESERGNLYVGEAEREVPFPIRRFYVITGIPEGGVVRADHAHKKAKQAVFCLKGSFTLILDDGKTKETRTLSNISKGALLEAKVWHIIKDISKDTIILIVSDSYYDESDYLRDYQEFLCYIA